MLYNKSFMTAAAGICVLGKTFLWFADMQFCPAVRTFEVWIASHIIININIYTFGRQSYKCMALFLMRDDLSTYMLRLCNPPDKQIHDK